jgi:hypothetical protein
MVTFLLRRVSSEPSFNYFACYTKFSTKIMVKNHCSTLAGLHNLDLGH